MEPGVDINTPLWIASFSVSLSLICCVCCCAVYTTEYSGHAYTVHDDDRRQYWPPNLSRKLWLTVLGILLDSLSLSALSFTVPLRNGASNSTGSTDNNSTTFHEAVQWLLRFTLEFRDVIFLVLFWISVAVGFVGTCVASNCCVIWKVKFNQDYSLSSDAANPNSQLGSRVRLAIQLVEFCFSTVSFSILKRLLTVAICDIDNNSLMADPEIGCMSTLHKWMLGWGTVAFVYYLIISTLVQLVSSAISSGNNVAIGDVGFNGFSIDERAPVGFKIEWKAMYVGLKLLSIAVTLFLQNSYPLVTLCLLFLITGTITFTTWTRFPHNVHTINILMITCYLSSFASVVVALCSYAIGGQDSWIPFVVWLVFSVVLIGSSATGYMGQFSCQSCILERDQERALSRWCVAAITCPVWGGCTIPCAYFDHRERLYGSEIPNAVPSTDFVCSHLRDFCPCKCCHKSFQTPYYPERPDLLYDSKRNVYRVYKPDEPQPERIVHYEGSERYKTRNVDQVASSPLIQSEENSNSTTNTEYVRLELNE